VNDLGGREIVRVRPEVIVWWSKGLASIRSSERFSASEHPRVNPKSEKSEIRRLINDLCVCVFWW
jgi:hypothetical protein